MLYEIYFVFDLYAVIQVSGCRANYYLSLIE